MDLVTRRVVEEHGGDPGRIVNTGTRSAVPDFMDTMQVAVIGAVSPHVSGPWAQKGGVVVFHRPMPPLVLLAAPGMPAETMPRPPPAPGRCPRVHGCQGIGRTIRSLPLADVQACAADVCRAAGAAIRGRSTNLRRRPAASVPQWQVRGGLIPSLAVDPGKALPVEHGPSRGGAITIIGAVL